MASDADREREAITSDLEQKLNKGIEQLFGPAVQRHALARAKYGPLVRKISDEDFAGLWLEVIEERERRMIRLAARLRR